MTWFIWIPLQSDVAINYIPAFVPSGKLPMTQTIDIATNVHNLCRTIFDPIVESEDFFCTKRYWIYQQNSIYLKERTKIFFLLKLQKRKIQNGIKIHTFQNGLIRIGFRIHCSHFAHSIRYRMNTNFAVQVNLNNLTNSN